MGGEKLPETNSVFLYELGGNPRHLTVKPLSEDLRNVGLKVADYFLTNRAASSQAELTSGLRLVLWFSSSREQISGNHWSLVKVFPGPSREISVVQRTADAGPFDWKVSCGSGSPLAAFGQDSSLVS
jgi:hypothetical protein